MILDNSQFSMPVKLEESDRTFSTTPTAEEKKKAIGLWSAAVARKDFHVNVTNVYRLKKTP